MTELEKLRAGLEYIFTDPEVRAIKLNVVKLCQKLNAPDVSDYATREEIIRELFGSAGENPIVMPVFNCDNEKNLHVDEKFFANCNVTIFDNREVHISDDVWIGANATILPGVTIDNNVVIAAFKLSACR